MTEALDPFYRDDDAYHATLNRRVSSLTDDELQQVHDLLDWRNPEVPFVYWMTGARVRQLIRKEQRRRKETAPNE